MAELRLSPFGRLLRQWRTLRGASQLQLATEAGTSTRHLSFVETGRSQPSREMVLRLAEALDVPLRERNALLQAAGFASLYRETALGAPELEPIGRVLDFLLERHEPFPAFLVDRCWNVLRANRAAQRVFQHFARPAPVWRESPANLMRLTLHPEGFRPSIVNFEEVAHWALSGLQREVAFAGPDPELGELLDEMLRMPDLPERVRVPDLDRPPQPVLPLHLKREGLELRIFSVITTFATPRDVTLQDLRIESFLPADAATENELQALAGKA